MTAPFKFGLLLLTAAALAGCAGRPHGMLVPVGAQAHVPGAHVVDMLVVTNRGRDGVPAGELFSGERAEKSSFADIAVSIPPDGARKIGEIQWPEEPPGDPTREFVTLRADIIDQSTALTRFDQRIVKTPKRHVLVFVHGFNTRFEEAVYRFAQIAHDSGASAAPVLFTWPSRGKLLAYGYDHESASYSRDSLEALLRALDRNKNVGEISLLAHSMGNWTTLEALRQMAIRDKAIGGKIKNVILAAPDVDFDVFRRQIHSIGARPGIFTVFVSRDDDALAASRRVWGDQVRLGAIEPDAQPYQSELKRDEISVIDLTDVTSSDRLGHGKFAAAPEVVRLIGARLSQGQVLTDSHAGVGDKVGHLAIGAGSALGSAAGLAVTLPLAVVDPRTRENLSERIEDLGHRARSAAQSGVEAAQSVPESAR